MRFFLIIFIFAFGLMSCAHHVQPSTIAKPNEETESIINKGLIDPTTEKALGESIFNSMIHKYKQIEISDEFKNYANDITKKLGENSNRPSISYEVFFLDSKELIAVGLPGGKVVISTAFLKIIGSESEFANLIANQIAHIAKQHLLVNLLRNSEYDAHLQAAHVDERITKQSVFILLDMGFEIQFVNEADRLAPTYAMHLGYNTDGLLTVLQKAKSSMEKTNTYGKTDLTYDLINHRTSMNQVFVKSLESVDKKDFPKPEDRFSNMFKKIKPVKKKTVKKQ